jgi:hypothetical protein
MSHTWEECADEFGRLTKQGKDVRLALLVACSVFKRGRGGNTTSNGQMTNAHGKVTAAEFARRAGVHDHKRVLRHLAAWDTFAEDNDLPPAKVLTPTDAYTLDITEAQAAAFNRLRITPEQTTPSAPPPTATATEATVTRRSRGTLAEQTVPKIHGFQMSQGEKERLGDAAEDLYVNGGYSLNEIGRAAGVKNNATIKKLLNDRGVDTSRRQARKEDPPPINWRPGAVQQDTIRLQQQVANNLRIVETSETDDSHVAFLRSIRARCEAMDDLSRLAWIFDRQIEAGNLMWVGEVESDLAWLHERLGNLVRIIRESEYREFCKSSPTVRTGWDEIQRNS